MDSKRIYFLRYPSEKANTSLLPLLDGSGQPEQQK